MDIDQNVLTLLQALNSPSWNNIQLVELLSKTNSYADHAKIEKLTKVQVYQAMWHCIRKGWAYLYMDQPNHQHWFLAITEEGEAILKDGEYDVRNAQGYLKKLGSETPEIATVALMYLEESLRSFSAENYLASTVMLGVSVEAVFYETADSFVKWTPDASGEKLKELLDKKSYNYLQKFVEFQKRILPLKAQIPVDLTQNLDLNLNSILELIRIARNETGHPTGIRITRQAAQQYIILFPFLVRRLYDLKKFFDAHPRTAPISGATS